MSSKKQNQVLKNLEELQALSSEEILKGRDSNNTPFLKILFEVHQALFQETCTTCPAKIAGYIHRIKNFKIEQMSQKSNFTLHTGAVIIFAGTSESYSNANLTDEIAIRFIRLNENRKSLFSKLPENIDELLSDEQVEKPFIERKQNDILPLIPQLELNEAEIYLTQENAKSKPREKVIDSLNLRISELKPADLSDENILNTDENEDELNIDSTAEVSYEQVD
ncbi:hypothetical protein [Empedobacter brevis]|uniref:hypothetical protein n=1 Tax=Empedobacter brevis TaxID=247 RepID=UPI003340EE73